MPLHTICWCEKCKAQESAITGLVKAAEATKNLLSQMTKLRPGNEARVRESLRWLEQALKNSKGE